MIAVDAEWKILKQGEKPTVCVLQLAYSKVKEDEACDETFLLDPLTQPQLIDVYKKSNNMLIEPTIFR